MDHVFDVNLDIIFGVMCVCARARMQHINVLVCPSLYLDVTWPINFNFACQGCNFALAADI